MRNLTKVKTISLSLVTILALGFSGCGSSSSNPPPAEDPKDDGVQITGSIPANKVAYIPTKVDKLLASVGFQPLYADYVGTANKVVVITPDYKIVTKDLDADGSFSIDLDTTKSSAIFLVNDNTKEVVGSVSIPTASGSSTTLDMMPKGKITKDLALGELSINSNTGTASSATANIKDNLGDDSAIKELAQVDDASKFYANYYRNSDYYFYTYWDIRYQKTDGNNFSLSDITDKFLTTFKTKIEGWQPRLMATQTAMTGVDKSEIKIYFPSNSANISYIKYSNQENDSGTYAGLTDTSMYMNWTNDNIIKDDGSNTNNSKIAEEPFAGGYTLKVNDVVKASFDAYSIKPYSTGTMADVKFDLQPLILVKLNSDPNDSTKISSVTWKFSRYDATQNKYVDLSDEAVKLYFAQYSSTFGFDCILGTATQNEASSTSIRNISELTGNNITKNFNNSLSKSDITKVISAFNVLGNEYDFKYSF